MERKETGGILTGYFRESDDYHIKRPAGMNQWLLFYTLKGEGYIRTAAGEKRCGPGELGLLRKGVPHAYGTVRGQVWHFMWAHFDALPQTNLLPDEETLVCDLAPAMQRRAVHHFKSLIQDSRDGGVFWQERCENLIGGLLLLAAERLADRLDPRVSRVIGVLSARMEEELTMDELAAVVGLSVSRLSHLFKSQTGRSVLDTLNGMRLEQAARLMVYARRKPTEAAFDVGFRSYNHFAALFRKRFGESPSRYRKAGPD